MKGGTRRLATGFPLENVVLVWFAQLSTSHSPHTLLKQQIPPLAVTPRGTAPDGCYLIDSGEMRWQRAFSRVLYALPCAVSLASMLPRVALE